MKTIKLLLFSLTILFTTACSKEAKKNTIVVKNSLAVERSFETIELTKDFLKVTDLSNLGVKDIAANKLVVTQLVDFDGDGVFDKLLFQPTLAANSEKEYEIINLSETDLVKPTAENLCYSRFVPERTDDYTWENNKVAFRVYGPTAQKMIEDNIPGGTLSSGVDAWLKKVEYPIINKWYKEDLEGIRSYHKDAGEGLDNFHVGVSRGVGGIAVKSENNYYFSKNYTEWRTITTGPIRTSFYLNYQDWDANGNTIQESKIISLDLGNNFSKFETTLNGTSNISAGLTLHEKDGEVSGNIKNGWVSYWQPHPDSEIGTAIIAANKYFVDFEKYDTDEIDLSNAYAHLNVIDGKVVYYAGFAWSESNQFPTKVLWEQHLNSVSLKINNPITVEIVE